MSVKELKEWKSVYDSFRAYCRKKKLPSESTILPCSSWVFHYESMQFLLGLQLQGLTTTNALDAEALAANDTGEAANDENYELNTNSSTDRYASNLSSISYRKQFYGREATGT